VGVEFTPADESFITTVGTSDAAGCTMAELRFQARRGDRNQRDRCPAGMQAIKKSAGPTSFEKFMKQTRLFVSITGTSGHVDSLRLSNCFLPCPSGTSPAFQE